VDGWHLTDFDGFPFVIFVDHRDRFQLTTRVDLALVYHADNHKGLWVYIGGLTSMCSTLHVPVSSG